MTGIMGAYGRQFRSERESRGLRLVDVALATEVPAHTLAALEHEHLRELAADPHAEDYVRTYAEYLGLDSTALMTEFLREFEPLRPAPAESVPSEVQPVAPPAAEVPPRQGTAVPRWAWIGALGLVAMVAGWAVMRATSTADATPDLAGAAAVAPVEVVADSEPDAVPVPATTPAEPRREPTPPAAVAAPDPAALTVSAHGVGTGVRNHRLVGAGDHFREGGQVVFLTRVLGGAKGRTIDHVWLRGGSEISRVTLTLGGPHWRTHSRKTLFPGSAGDWTVEARDPSGNLLARSSFTCVR